MSSLLTSTPNPQPWISYVSITDLESWYKAIEYSQNSVISSNIVLFELKTDLIFTKENPVYLKGTSGDRDTHFLLIKSNQEFRGNGHSITLERDCFKDNRAVGIFRLRGSSNFPAFLHNLFIFCKETLITQRGALLCSSFGMIEPKNIKIRNFYVEFNGWLEDGVSIILNHWATPIENVRFENCQLEMGDVKTLGGVNNQWNGYLRAGKGVITFVRCSVVSMGLLVPTEIDFALFAGNVSFATVLIHTCFSELPRQGGQLLFINDIGDDTQVSFVNIYTLTGPSNMFYEGLFFLGNTINRTARVRVENYYSNLDRDDSIRGLFVYPNSTNVSLFNINNRFDFFSDQSSSTNGTVVSKNTKTLSPQDTKPAFLPTSPPFYERSRPPQKKKVLNVKNILITLLIVFGILVLILAGLGYFVWKKKHTFVLFRPKKKSKNSILKRRSSSVSKKKSV